MPMITTKDGVDIFYKDWGKGQPIVFSHGWPLSSDDWDTQMLFFQSNGFRVIAHDRRGHGRSSQVGDGHDGKAVPQEGGHGDGRKRNHIHSHRRSPERPRPETRDH